MIKNKNICIIIICCLIMIITIITFNTLFSSYSREAYVESNKNNIITFIDLQGNSWTYEAITTEEQIFKPWDKVVLTFDTNKTDDNIFDDILKKVEKRG